LSIAAAWALFVLCAAIFSFAVWPFHGWSRSDQLSLFQSAVGLAGFGGAVVALIFAGRSIAERYGGPELLITKDPELMELTARDSPGVRDGGRSTAFHTFSIEVFNEGSAIAQTWQLRLEVDAPWVLDPHERVGDVSKSFDMRTLVWNGQAPLFTTSPTVVGPFNISARVKDFDGVPGDDFAFTITAIVVTEFGGDDSKVFDGKLHIERDGIPKPAK